MKFINTKMAARILNVSIHRLHQAAWLEKFPPPNKVNGGFVWSIEDLRRAHRTLHGTSLDVSTIPAEFADVATILTARPGVIA